MDFRELTYITAIADCGSVTEAAKKLYISQPSLSYILGRVEEDLGVRLFDRKTSPLTLTYAGERYVETARQILLLSGNLRRELKDIGGGAKGEIRIGIPTERAGYMLPRVLDRFRDRYPGVQIRLVESRSAEILKELDKDRISFAVLPGAEDEFPIGLENELIYRERIRLVVPEGMETPADLKALKDQPFLIMKSGQYIRKKTEQILRRAGFFPKNVMEISSCLTAVELVRAEMGVTIVPERALEELQFQEGKKSKTRGVQVLSCGAAEEDQSWDVRAVYKKETYLGEPERFLIDVMKETFHR